MKQITATSISPTRSFQKTILFLSLVLSLIAAPALSFAKNDDAGKNKNKKEVSSIQKSDDRNDDSRKGNDDRRRESDDDSEDKNKSNTSNNGEVKRVACIRAFGHLIAPGWKKNNGSIEPSEHCWYPFGIAKKFKGDHSSTTPDLIAPIISDLTVTKVTNAKVVLSWKTNEAATDRVIYNTSTPVSELNASNTARTDWTLNKNHTLTLTGLSSNTTYYALVVSKDAAGNASIGQTISFTTGSITPTPSDTTPPVIKSVTGFVGTSTIQTAWQTNELSTSKIYYGTTLPVDVSATNPLTKEDTTLVKNHTLQLTGLSANTVYYFVIESKDANNNISRTGQFVLKTLAAPAVPDTTPPTISNLLIGSASTSVSTNFTTNEPTTARLFYSTSTPLNLSTALFIDNLVSSTTHHFSVPNLATGTPYYLRIEVKDAALNSFTSGEFATSTTAGL